MTIRRALDRPLRHASRKGITRKNEKTRHPPGPREAARRLEAPQVADHRLQGPVEQQGIVQQAYRLPAKLHRQAHAGLFQDLHPGAIDEDVATGGPDHCRQLAAQLVLGVLLDLHPTADTQRIDRSSASSLSGRRTSLSTGAGAASGEVRTISSTTRSMTGAGAFPRPCPGSLRRAAGCPRQPPRRACRAADPGHAGFPAG